MILVDCLRLSARCVLEKEVGLAVGPCYLPPLCVEEGAEPRLKAVQEDSELSPLVVTLPSADARRLQLLPSSAG